MNMRQPLRSLKVCCKGQLITTLEVGQKGVPIWDHYGLACLAECEKGFVEMEACLHSFLRWFWKRVWQKIGTSKLAPAYGCSGNASSGL